MHAGARIADRRTTKVGGFSGKPVMLIAPPIAWAIGS
jgi:hypothetical protein